MRVYISPSNQPHNRCVLGHSEKQHCEQLTQLILPHLAAYGIQYMVGTDVKMERRVGDATRWGAQLYLPLHTNATSNGRARGTTFGFYPGRADGMKAGVFFKKHWQKIYPLPNLVRVGNYSFYEARAPICPSVYIELLFHDNRDDATWLHNNMERIARNLADAIADYFGVFEQPASTPAPVPVKSPTDGHVVSLKITRKENADYHKKAIGDIIQLPIEDYLLGVVPAKIGNPHLEAAKAHTIAARTFGYVRSRGGTVIDDTVTYQAYRAPRATNKAYGRAHQAVRETAGQVLYHDGKIVETAVYSHSNGGTMTSSKDRWGGDRPYLQGGPDPWTAATGEKKNGHGVGMSQVGAIHAAGLGVSHQAILAFYYPGTEIYPPAAAAPEPVPVPPESSPEPAAPDQVLYQAVAETRYPLSLGLWREPARATRLKFIPKGDLVEVLQETSATWAMVRHQGMTGYVDRQYLRPAAEKTDDVLYLATVKTQQPNSLNIWREPRKGISLARVPRDAQVQVLQEVNKTWAKIRYGSHIGYVDRQYLEVVKNDNE